MTRTLLHLAALDHAVEGSAPRRAAAGGEAADAAHTLYPTRSLIRRPSCTIHHRSQTGEPLNIAAKTVPGFTAGKAFKESVAAGK